MRTNPPTNHPPRQPQAGPQPSANRPETTPQPQTGSRTQPDGNSGATGRRRKPGPKPGRKPARTVPVTGTAAEIIDIVTESMGVSDEVAIELLITSKALEGIGERFTARFRPKMAEMVEAMKTRAQS